MEEIERHSMEEILWHSIEEIRWPSMRKFGTMPNNFLGFDKNGNEYKVVDNKVKSGIKSKNHLFFSSIVSDLIGDEKSEVQITPIRIAA